MAFSTNIFLFVFLPLTVIGYYLIREKLRNAFLLIASFAFFAWSEPRGLAVLLAVIGYSYIIALLMEKNRGRKVNKALLWMAVIVNVAILGYYKYTNFGIDIINSIAAKGIAHKDILLPVGISFFVFQSISYVADVYSGRVAADKNIIRVALYFAFFPKVTQGPIMRYPEMAGDLRHRKEDVEQMSDGIRRFVIGLTKKLLIADQLGRIADPIFGLEAQGLSLPLAWGGIIAYTLQIYFDFSGYSDMAVGLGKLFGFRITENFNYPYVSKSVTDFWRRWHISLSSWFRDYVYIPLGGNRRGNQYVNLFIVFLLTGLWHGASWTFIVWGVYHGVLRIIEKRSGAIRNRLPGVLQWALTMLLVMIGWVFFRASDLPAAIHYLATMFGIEKGLEVQYRLTWFYDNKAILITLIGLLAMLPWKQLIPAYTAELEAKPAMITLKYLTTLVLLLVCLALIMTNTYSSFIYFKF